MEFKHYSVMLSETVDALNVTDGGIYADGTLGGGGHSFEIFKGTDCQLNVSAFSADYYGITRFGIIVSVGNALIHSPKRSTVFGRIGCICVDHQTENSLHVDTRYVGIAAVALIIEI